MLGKSKNRRTLERVNTLCSTLIKYLKPDGKRNSPEEVRRIGSAVVGFEVGRDIRAFFAILS